jgi:hypothetical protein
MQSYGFNAEELKELGTYIQAGLLNPKLGPEQLILQLRQLPVYKARFAGNEERRARGLNALSEANYLHKKMPMQKHSANMDFKDLTLVGNLLLLLVMKYLIQR